MCFVIYQDKNTGATDEKMMVIIEAKMCYIFGKINKINVLTIYTGGGILSLPRPWFKEFIK